MASTGGYSSLQDPPQAPPAAPAETGKRRQRFTRAYLKGNKDSVLCLASDALPSSSSKASSRQGPPRLASGSSDGSMRLWDLRCPTGRRCVRAAFVDDEVCSVAISTAKEHLLLASSGTDVIGFDLRSERVLLKEPDNLRKDFAKEEINQIVIDSAGHLAALAEDSGAVHLLDLNTWRLEKTLGGKKCGHDNICSSVAFQPGSGWGLASGGLDAAVILWKRSGRGKISRLLPDAGEESATSTGGPQLLNPPFVHSLSFSPDGQALAAGLGDGTIALLDGETGEQKSRLRGQHGAAVAQVLHTPVGLISAGNDCQIVHWADTRISIPHTEKVNCLAWCENTLFVAGLGNDIVAYGGFER